MIDRPEDLLVQRLGTGLGFLREREPELLQLTDDRYVRPRTNVVLIDALSLDLVAVALEGVHRLTGVLNVDVSAVPLHPLDDPLNRVLQLVGSQEASVNGWPVLFEEVGREDGIHRRVHPVVLVGDRNGGPGPAGTARVDRLVETGLRRDRRGVDVTRRLWLETGGHVRLDDVGHDARVIDPVTRDHETLVVEHARVDLGVVHDQPTREPAYDLLEEATPAFPGNRKAGVRPTNLDEPNAVAADDQTGRLGVDRHVRSLTT